MSNNVFSPLSDLKNSGYKPRKFKASPLQRSQEKPPISSPIHSHTEDSNFKMAKSSRKNNNYNNNKKVNIPDAVLVQRELRRKHKYVYRVANNGNIENNSTIYVVTTVAYPHQLEAQFEDALARAKNMPEIFGEDFECDFQVNVVRRYTGEYMGYAFVDVTNPKFYYALLGYNVNGSDRAEYVDDPNWTQPKIIPKAPRESLPDPVVKVSSYTFLMTQDWGAELSDEDRQLRPPKIRRELPPLITLGKYEYDDEQKLHLQTDVTHGTFSVSPAFISPGVKEDYDDCALYVSEVPAMDYDFLYALFARYARTTSSYEKDYDYFPRIEIRKCTKEGEVKDDDKTGIFAIVKYAHPFDTAFSLCMIQKIRANYHGTDVSMPVRYAFSTKNKGNKTQF